MSDTKVDRKDRDRSIFQVFNQHIGDVLVLAISAGTNGEASPNKNASLPTVILHGDNEGNSRYADCRDAVPRYWHGLEP